MQRLGYFRAFICKKFSPDAECLATQLFGFGEASLVGVNACQVVERSSHLRTVHSEQVPPNSQRFSLHAFSLWQFALPEQHKTQFEQRCSRLCASGAI